MIHDEKKIEELMKDKNINIENMVKQYAEHIRKQTIEKVKTILESPACKQLTENQRQLDQDGCIVGVSRQAIEETLSALNDLE